MPQRGFATWLVDDVVEGIEEELSEAALAKLAFKSSTRAVGIHPGLEVAAVIGVRDAATELSNALRFRKKELITKAIAKRLELLADEWQETEAVPTAKDDENLRLVLGLLQKTNQTVSIAGSSSGLIRLPQSSCVSERGDD